MAQTVTVTPPKFAWLLPPPASNREDGYRYYWTGPIASVPAATRATLARDVRRLFRDLHPPDARLLDPRGPSLWLATAGSGTQCHYDVADNVLVQLSGTKRVRCFPPGAGAKHLHVFPDAHPRARKAQVDFDRVPAEGDEAARRFPHFAAAPPPALDAVLRPGDAVAIPAFWFHHVENGEDTAAEGGAAPSVSVNSFSLSRPMMVAQQIFRRASLRPLRLMGAGHVATGAAAEDEALALASSLLRVLGTALVRGLRVVEEGREEAFVRRYLLEARYGPLRCGNPDGGHRDNEGGGRPRKSLTPAQRQAAQTCVVQVLPDFRRLLAEEEGDGAGIALLVGLHLLELWAVELVGAPAVAAAWDGALA